jgi:hypothetical protein
MIVCGEFFTFSCSIHIANLTQEAFSYSSGQVGTCQDDRRREEICFEGVRWTYWGHG